VKSKLQKSIRVTQSYWNHIVEVKHNEVLGKDEEVKRALASPVEVRKSKKDPSVYLYYLRVGNKFITVVTKHLNGEGFIISVYFTRRIGKTGSEKVVVE
jgi:hypothetical protein